ncbi:MAG: hypothetical protein Q9157_002141 [Trypethelium eluteriae]
MGLARIDESPPGCIEVANELLQANHNKHHMFFRDVAGHNHIPHSILTVLAMGGGPKELKRAYDDSEAFQQPLLPVDHQVVHELRDPDKFLARMQQLSEYPNFLHFFEQEIEAKSWQAVVNEYCFSRTPLADTMLSQLFEGLYHPIIHMAYGIEFDQPSIVAEGLAQAASHNPGHVDEFFNRSEQLARSGSVKAKPLKDLYAEVHASEKIRASTWLKDGPLRSQGVLKRAMEDLAAVAAQFQIAPTDLERGKAEMISCGAFTSAGQKAGKMCKIDFFYLHIVTCSIMVDVMLRESWITLENKARLIEWKGRLDLVWYASSGAADLRAKHITAYTPTLSKGMDWHSMYKASNDIHDDGHIVKFIRALKNGEDVVKPFEQSQDTATFPVTGDMWLKIAQMCYDGTATIGPESPHELSKKWVWGAGFDLPWMKVPDLNSIAMKSDPGSLGSMDTAQNIAEWVASAKA